MEATNLLDYFRYEGMIGEKKDMVRRMYRNGRPLPQIAEDTGLSIEVVTKLIIELSAKDDSVAGALGQ